MFFKKLQFWHFLSKNNIFILFFSFFNLQKIKILFFQYFQVEKNNFIIFWTFSDLKLIHCFFYAFYLAKIKIQNGEKDCSEIVGLSWIEFIISKIQHPHRSRSVLKSDAHENRFWNKVETFELSIGDARNFERHYQTLVQAHNWNLIDVYLDSDESCIFELASLCSDDSSQRNHNLYGLNISILIIVLIMCDFI